MRLAVRLRGIAAGACAGCGLGLAATAHAVLLAYEPFEYGDVAVPAEGQYAVGDENAGVGLLGGQDPPIGPTAFYTGPWVQSGGDSQVVKALPSHAYPDYPAGVGGIQQDTIQFSCCSFGRSGRPITTLGGGPERLIVYESFLIDFGSQGTDPVAQFGLRGHELWDGAVGDAFRCVMLFVDHFEGIDELSLRVETPSTSQTVPIQGGGLTLPVMAALNGGVHLVVMRYDFAPGLPDSVRVYFDPIGELEPAVPDAVVIVPESDLLITHHGAFSQFIFSGAGHVPGAIDEIRLVTSAPLAASR